MKLPGERDDQCCWLFSIKCGILWLGCSVFAGLWIECFSIYLIAVLNQELEKNDRPTVPIPLFVVILAVFELVCIVIWFIMMLHDSSANRMRFLIAYMSVVLVANLQFFIESSKNATGVMWVGFFIGDIWNVYLFTWIYRYSKQFNGFASAAVNQGY